MSAVSSALPNTGHTLRGAPGETNSRRNSPCLDKASDDQNVRKRFLDLILEIRDKASRGQQPLIALLKSETARWTQIIKGANLKGQ